MSNRNSAAKKTTRPRAKKKAANKSRSGLFLIRRRSARGKKKASMSVVPTSRHVVAPATANQIRASVGVTDTEMQTVRRIIAKYSPIATTKKKDRAPG